MQIKYKNGVYAEDVCSTKQCDTWIDKTAVFNAERDVSILKQSVQRGSVQHKAVFLRK